ncbi:hypothetical protein IHE45_17G114400 [Dioscorea alata]|uniref:Uncharacterized protein n=1 Tax=Dioscorea alata TaxID=55571 RepID=A0ACB7UEQ8_DIOAL|nr:hypothetical protein IHE45_17G114400 [Dioscorea alata]
MRMNGMDDVRSTWGDHPPEIIGKYNINLATRRTIASDQLEELRMDMDSVRSTWRHHPPEILSKWTKEEKGMEKRENGAEARGRGCPGNQRVNYLLKKYTLIFMQAVKLVSRLCMGLRCTLHGDCAAIG